MRHLRFVAVAAILLAACVPGLEPGYNGFTGAKGPGYGSITVAEQPTFLGDGPNSGATFWNIAAGRPLFVRSDTNPQVTFVAGGPFITPPAFGSRRVVAYASRDYTPQNGVTHCRIYYDPSYVAAGVAGRHLNARVWMHEIGHCLMLDSHRLGVLPCPSTAVMSDCDFWNRVLAGWGPTAADTAQLRAAGYIP